MYNLAVKLWPAARAALITATIGVGLVDGCPLRGRRVPDDDAVTPALAAAAGSVARLQRTVMTPFRPIRDGLRFTQGWRLFPVANRDRFRMWIEAREGPVAPWELLYRPHDPVHTVLGDELEYRRVRGAWNPGTRNARGAYPHFVTWVARTMFAREPRFQEVRVRMERLAIDPRAGTTGATGEFIYVQSRRRPAEPRR